MLDDHYDVFLSYCTVDKARADYLARGLTAARFRVFHHAWEIDPGDSVVGKLDTGMGRAHNGVVLLSRAAMRDRWALEQYAALATLAVDGKVDRLVPVVWDAGLQLPPMLASTTPVSFVDAVDPQALEERLRVLADALLRARDSRPIEVVLGVPADDALLRATPANLTIRIDDAATTLVREDGTSLRVEHSGVTGEIRHALRTADRERRAVDRVIRATRVGRPNILSPAASNALDAANRAVGARLAEVFLPDPVGAALAKTVAAIDRSGRIVRLAVETEAHTDIANLPWESLVLPGLSTPVSLYGSVRMYRHVAGLGPTAVRQVPGPLRILAVIASPDVGDHELLDYEHELASILRGHQSIT